MRNLVKNEDCFLSRFGRGVEKLRNEVRVIAEIGRVATQQVSAPQGKRRVSIRSQMGLDYPPAYRGSASDRRLQAELLGFLFAPAE